MTGEEELAVRQATGLNEAAFAVLLAQGYGPAAAQAVLDRLNPQPCSWGDDAWHRAVSRLIRIHRGDYRRLLAEERDKTGGAP